mmetsp:Transcript_47236/g.156571  ORF Transcript_47236/g.156571 Transcript_47236/m.156571 type:complete len:244 (-) Transcript_47236:50-781(-)
MMPPPHVRSICLPFSLYCCRTAVTIVENSCRSSGRTPVSAMAVAFFWCTRAPIRALEGMMQYGMSILRQTAGSQMTSSIGSTSAAITTSCAFFCSQSLVMWWMPHLMKSGFFDSSASPFSTFSADACSRSFFSALDSGRYLCSSLKRLVWTFLSSLLVNWLIDGGTLSRWYSTLRCRWIRTYFGHRTYRVRLRLGRMSCPMPKCFGLASQTGPVGSAFLDLGSAYGVGGGAFLDFAALGMTAV